MSDRPRTQIERLTAVEIVLDEVKTSSEKVAQNFSEYKESSQLYRQSESAMLSNVQHQLASIYDTQVKMQMSLKEVQEIQAAMGLNGHTKSLKQVANAAPELLRVAAVAPTLEKIAAGEMHKAIAKDYLFNRGIFQSRITRAATSAIFGAILFAVVVQGPVGGAIVTAVRHIFP